MHVTGRIDPLNDRFVAKVCAILNKANVVYIQLCLFFYSPGVRQGGQNDFPHSKQLETIPKSNDLMMKNL